jgi:hypothetical protein
VGQVSQSLSDTQMEVDSLNTSVKNHRTVLREAEEERSEANTKMLKVIALVMGRVQAIAP